MLVWFTLILVCGALYGSYAKAECGTDEFPCNDGTCVDKSKWCDSVEHCRDDSDELYCYKGSVNFPNPNRCNESFFFICLDGPCIPLAGHCDGYPSCPDLSDEADCSTTSHQTTNYSESELPHVESTHVGTTIRMELPSMEYDGSTEITFENVTSTETAVPKKSLYSTVSQRMTSEHLQTFNDYFNRTESNDIPQADTVSKKTEKVFKDITKGFTKLGTRAFSRSKESAEKWILSVRDQDYGWGDETARAITALYMSDDSLKETQEKMLMTKELHLEISMALLRNQTSQVSLSELALYINALLASCDNPRNFYGNDLVDILRHRTNAAQIAGEFVSPLVYSTLCFSNANTLTDVRKIQETFFNSRSGDDRIGIQALATLASICVSNKPEFQTFHLGLQLAKSLYDKIAKQGLPENIYELALTVQALNEAKVNQDLWNRSDALHRISQLQESDGSWGDIMATYYVLPILSGKALSSSFNHCHLQTEVGMTPVDVIMNSKADKLPVMYSLYFGEPMEVSQSLRMRVSKSANLLDIMRIAERENPIYRFKFDMTRGKPSVYSIGGMANDAEQGLYWVLHISRSNATRETNVENIVRYEGDIRNYLLNAADHIIFWFKKLH